MGQTYPGIIPDPEAATRGVLYLKLDAATIRSLDAFEGPMYYREVVQVETLRGETQAEAYVIKPEYRDHVSTVPWDVDTFKKHHLQDFLRDYAGFKSTFRTKPG